MGPGLATTWLVMAVFGTVLMVRYADQPGAAGKPPSQWPVASRMEREPGRPTLVMFVHPQCPCSKASVGELALLMAHCEGRVSARVLFLQPANEPAGWVQSDTWREASAIPGVTVGSDPAGREAQLFQAATSGDTVLYDAAGRLVFHGGITISRGHAGDNPGRAAVQALLLGQTTRPAETPVFGCSLFGCTAPAAKP